MSTDINNNEKISNVHTTNKNNHIDLINTETIVGGNIISNPNPLNYRGSGYTVLTNESNIDIHVCPPKTTSIPRCTLPIEEPIHLINKRSICLNKLNYQTQTQKVINNEVRIDSSLQTDNISSRCYLSKKNSYVKKNVPTRGNSTKSSVTSLKPGSLSANGYGVHKKHGSYQRRLLDLKHKCLNIK